MKRLSTLVLLALAALSFGHTKAKTPAPITFTVTNTGASGPGSFDQALADANANPGLDTIAFNIPGPGPHTIQTNTFLGVADAVVIDGYTQPGASPNTNPPNLGTNAVLKIELDQSISGGLVLFADNCLVRGLVINRSPFSAIFMRGSNNVIEGNFIGTDVSGTAALGNNGYTVVSENASNNRIGGTSAAARNLISGNNNIAVLIGGGDNNKVQGNLLGTDRTGMLALGNVHNISVPGATNTLIGGTAADARNIISASSSFFGVAIYFGAAGTVVQGNYIGTDVTGTQPLGNQQAGVVVEGLGPTPASNTLIGGTTPGAGNLIAYNQVRGVLVFGGALQTIVQGNSIGTDASGTLNLGNAGDGVQIFDSACQIGGAAAGAGNKIAFNTGAGVAVGSGTGSAIASNAIFANGGLGIDLNNDGVTVNDAGDADTGANNLQNYPVLTAVTCGTGSAAIQGTLNSAPNTNYRIEFFANAVCDASGFGEGATYLGAISVTTDGSGNASFSAPVSVTAGQNVTATATDPVNNTSEFSPCFVAPSLPPVISGASATPATLWPPNHKMVDVTVNYSATSNCGSGTGVSCTLSVTSNEPINGTGDGDTAPDWEIVDAHHLRLRAERAGIGSGRIYTITITCTDSFGNTSTQSVTVAVPHNQ